MDDPVHAERRDALRQQLFAEFEAQGDPRVSGGGDVFDAYPYADESGRDFYERFARGEKPASGWVDPSDFEKEAIE